MVATAAPAESASTLTPPGDLPPLATRLVALAALAKVVFHLSTATVLGFHRDEFYYLAGGRHLSWGYVDHPPLTPFLDRVSETLLGDSQFALHVLPALVGGLLVVLAAVLARELGGGRTAQGITMLVAGLGPLYLTPMHFLGTVTVDLLAWAAATWLVIRIVRTGDVRLWLAVGAVVGLGLLNKHSMLFWLGGAGVGLLLSPERRLLGNRWFVAGAALATLMFLPNLVWQIQHHWPTLEFLGNLRAEHAAEDMSQFIPLQFGIVTIAGTALWVVALRRLLRDPAWRQYRWLAIAYGLLFVVLFASGGKAYYLGSIYLPLVAIGAVVVEQSWTRVARRRLVAAIVATGILLAPVFTPLLPTSALATVPLQKVNGDASAMLGWHDVARQIATAYHRLPADQQRSGVIFTANYSEAGAVDYWKHQLDLPGAISGHNTYWYWGYQPERRGVPVLAVGFDQTYLNRFFGGCQHVGVLHAAHDLMDSVALGEQLTVCQTIKAGWAATWPKLKHFQ